MSANKSEWPGDKLRREIAKLEIQRAHVTLLLELELKHVKELESDIERIESELSAMRAEIGGAK